MFQGYDLKHFFKFIIPSILAFTILGVYSVVDGFFVGNALGDAGVSAINIVFPAVALTFALGSGIGLGGAVIWSIESGRGNLEKAYKSLKVALILLALISLIITIVPFVLMVEILGSYVIQKIFVLHRHYYGAYQILITSIFRCGANFHQFTFNEIRYLHRFSSLVLLYYVLFYILPKYLYLRKLLP